MLYEGKLLLEMSQCSYHLFQFSGTILFNLCIEWQLGSREPFVD